MKRGQYIRLLLATTANPSTVIAAAKQASLHGSAQTEDSTTKDTTGDALEYDITGMSYDISGSGLILSPSDALLTGAISLNDLEGWVKDQLLYWRICVMEGTNNRTIVEEIASGQGKLTQLKADAPNRQNSTFSYTITGYGAITVGTAPVNNSED